MQLASFDFVESMKQPIRNRAYVRVAIGVVNSQAQKNGQITDTNVTYFADTKKPFNGYSVGRVYATAEENFTRVDGTMYFLPEQNSGYTYHNQGIVTRDVLGAVRITFGKVRGLDIKGITLDFGHSYPTEFVLKTNISEKTYENKTQKFTTEDALDNINYIEIRPIKMVSDNCRLRIQGITFGIANIFSNEKIISVSSKEYVSPIAETIPSMDTEIVIDNQDLYYSVDNPESAIAYMEIGQEVKITYGYDVTGDGDIEWLEDTATYLQSWSADDVQAKFTSRDRFYQFTDTYYKGLYRPNGISLYDLAVDVLADAGIEDDREYYLDPYLKNIIVYNPIPPVKHSEALQIIANAGRCVLYEDRSNKIHMKASFVPDMVASSYDQAEISNISKLLKDSQKNAYAIASNDFTTVSPYDETLFLPENMDELVTGYVSNSVADSNGVYRSVPKITIDLESQFVAYGLVMNFRHTHPTKVIITTYNGGSLVDYFEDEITDNEYITDYRFAEFEKMEVEFPTGHPNARVVLDNLLIGDVTDYTLTRDFDLTASPKGTRQDKIKSISITKNTYRASEEGEKELVTEKVTVDSDTLHDIYFTYPSYDLKASLKNEIKNGYVTIVEQSNYFARVLISGITSRTEVEISIEGKEYVADENFYKVTHNNNGDELSWNNPLISTDVLARDLEEWLASYYLGDVEYDIEWRGDPRAEANDLFYLELKNREPALIRSIENSLTYNGAWKGSMKTRKVVAKWQ